MYMILFVVPRVALLPHELLRKNQWTAVRKLTRWQTERLVEAAPPVQTGLSRPAIDALALSLQV